MDSIAEDVIFYVTLLHPLSQSLGHSSRATGLQIRTPTSIVGVLLCGRGRWHDVRARAQAAIAGFISVDVQ